jgi:DMSO reductase anchor subunit
MPTPGPVELMPAVRQSLWRWPAVLNFFLGGLGAGFYVVSALAGGLGDFAAMGPAAWLGPVLVLAGFAAVATEAGRPLRGPLVLRQVRTSWMSRELAVGAAFVLLSAADALGPSTAWRALAALCAVILTVAQGFILRQARAVAAWDVPTVPALFAVSALASGTGLYLLVHAGAGRGVRPAVVAGAIVVQVTSVAAWTRYLARPSAPAFARSAQRLARGRAFHAIVLAGHIAPFLLTAVAVAEPGLAIPVLAAAGALMIWGQLELKRGLILEAGHLRPVTLAGLAIRRRLA